MEKCKTCTSHIVTGEDKGYCLFYTDAIFNNNGECNQYREADSCRADRLEAENNKLKEALEEIANGHLQELVSEAIARQVLKELD